jgi:multidrug efflux system outer membrane protein
MNARGPVKTATRSLRIPMALAAMLLAAGCATLEPHLPIADPAIPSAWPLPPTTPGAPAIPAEPERASASAVADIGWRDFFVDPRLQELIARALQNNRDLRTALLNVERARSLYRIQRADLVPSVGIDAVASRSGGSTGLGVARGYSADIGIAAYELDLFGRVRSLSRVALQQYFATEGAHRSAQLTLVAEIANAWLTVAADQELLRVAQATLKSQEDSFRLTEQRHKLGAVSGLDLAQARTTVETARADSARFAGRLAQDRNALTLLVGAGIEPGLLPDRLEEQVSGLSALPAMLPSEVLLRRPDVMQAEHQLRAANANIGAARAAFFPSIALTGRIGSLSSELSGLFSAGSGGWSFIPQLHLPIFEGGRLRAYLGVARADREIALAQYEKTIQTGFREVADGLALTRTLAEQRQAQLALVAAASNAYDLSQARYKAGQDSFLATLDAQRTLYTAQQALISTRLAEQSNRVTLYKVLGGGWVEKSS